MRLIFIFSPKSKYDSKQAYFPKMMEYSFKNYEQPSHKSHTHCWKVMETWRVFSSFNTEQDSLEESIVNPSGLVQRPWNITCDWVCTSFMACSLPCVCVCVCVGGSGGKACICVCWVCSEWLKRFRRFSANRLEIWPHISHRSLLNIWIIDGVQQRSGLLLGGLLSAACLSAGRTGIVDAES